jgi:SAM-dependent methyltransferase
MCSNSALERLLGRRALFHWTRVPAYWGTTTRIARALDLRDGERVLDVGCGTGFFSKLVPHGYVGIDTEYPSTHFARRRTPPAAHQFLTMSATHLGFAKRSFDKALVINIIHHLDTRSTDRLLSQLRTVVRKRVVLVDGAPDIANAIERFFIHHDRGAHVRQRSALRTMIEPHYDVEDEEVFHNTLHTVPQVLFTLRPRT